MSWRALSCQVSEEPIKTKKQNESNGQDLNHLLQLQQQEAKPEKLSTPSVPFSPMEHRQSPINGQVISLPKEPQTKGSAALWTQGIRIREQETLEWKSTKF